VVTLPVHALSLDEAVALAIPDRIAAKFNDLKITVHG